MKAVLQPLPSSLPFMAQTGESCLAGLQPPHSAGHEHGEHPRASWAASNHPLFYYNSDCKAQRALSFSKAPLDWITPPFSFWSELSIKEESKKLQEVCDSYWQRDPMLPARWASPLQPCRHNAVNAAATFHAHFGAMGSRSTNLAARNTTTLQGSARFP